MILVLGKIVSHHFRHKANGCPNYETIEHLEMKIQMGDLLSSVSGTKCHYEQGVFDSNGKLTNIIDVLVFQNRSKYAIECQATSMANEEAMRRTYELNKHGYAVLWILSDKNFQKNLVNYRTIHGEYFAEKRLLQPEPSIYKIFYGRIYYLDTINNIITPIHYEKIKRYYESDYEINFQLLTSYRWLKSTRYVYSGPEIKNFKLLKTNSVDLSSDISYTIGRFYDKKWW